MSNLRLKDGKMMGEGRMFYIDILVSCYCCNKLL